MEKSRHYKSKLKSCEKCGLAIAGIALGGGVIATKILKK